MNAITEEQFPFQLETRKLSSSKQTLWDLLVWIGWTHTEITVPLGFALLLVLWITSLVLWIDRYPVSPLRPPELAPE